MKIMAGIRLGVSEETIRKYYALVGKHKGNAKIGPAEYFTELVDEIAEKEGIEL